jgi:hypothetical protein
MTTDDIRSLILGASALEPPYDIAAGGRLYTVSDATNVWIAGAYPDTLIVAIPKEGVVFVRLDSITAIHAEHQAVASGRK